MNKEKIAEILTNHKHWILRDVDGWGSMRADLRNADLRDADIRDADLRGADLRNADLRDADIRDADLRDADLRDADLGGADLRYAILRYAILRGADLGDADLRDADLGGADLRYAILRGAILRGADLRNADLRGADLRNADLRDAILRGADLKNADLRDAKNVPFIPLVCPDTGSFIGYKKANGYIVKLEILADARRSSATSRKCRCDKARVLDITTLDGGDAGINEVASSYDNHFVYRIGEIVEEPKFCDDRWYECAPGIHFFINRQEAVDY